MSVWQLDFFRRPLRNEDGEVLWELLGCDRAFEFRFQCWCPQSQASSDWIVQQLQSLDRPLPEVLATFRPESLSLIQEAARKLGITAMATRRTETLKRWLLDRVTVYQDLPGYTSDAYQPLAVPRPAPIPVADDLWGDRWRFATLPVAELDSFAAHPMRVRSLPQDLHPLQLGLASTQSLPGLIIDGGRKSLQLAQWLESITPVAVNYVPGAPDGLILEAGLADRWVLATFDDPEVQAAARLYYQRQNDAKGLHFLVIQPDDSGHTYTGLWLLRPA
ncbi:DUF1092 family protein [Geitlerinema sp. P-1104]|uniref:Tab2/Atab2 family RNA-binding protein n=1 Tax=Geitlerinema sp. P-1104 TaxID=2546230 RepID=UPI0014772F1C|nr:Tab2/Atab2 family RNA-binding protein [Geitlerinema sp. P-1104]NMG59326.1 DUF1092 family protein [Geitlerinema sp. P-1104]